MAILLSIPITGLLIMFQAAVVSRMQLLHGTADLLLLTLVAWALQERVKTAWHWSLIGSLFAGLVSALPLFVFPAGYLVTTGLALYLRRRVWKVPILAMFVVTFFGTILIQVMSALSIWARGAALPLLEILNMITLPSLLLNLLLALPIYILVGDLANWLYPKEIET